MFTGLVSAVGNVRGIEGSTHEFTCPRGWLAGVAVGNSIAANGVCLTATAINTDDDSWTADISSETRACCIPFVCGAAVNLEQALRVGDSLGGHFVSGHVDGQATITALNLHGEECELRAHAPAELARFIARKGAVTLNGVSLTVNEVADAAGESGDTSFSVWLIPHTRHNTTFATAQVGDKLNLEVDLIARYTLRACSS